MGSDIQKQQKKDADKKKTPQAPLKKTADGEVVEVERQEQVQEKSSIFSCGAGRTSNNTNAQKAKRDQRMKKTEKDYDQIMENALKKRNQNLNNQAKSAQHNSELIPSQSEQIDLSNNKTNLTDLKMGGQSEGQGLGRQTVNIIGTNKIQEPEVRNYSGYFKAKEAKQANGQNYAADTVSNDTYHQQPQSYGMVEESKTSQIVTEEFDDDMEIPDQKLFQTGKDTENQILYENLNYLKELNESIHGYQQIEEDVPCGGDCDYDIDGLTPTNVPDSSSASPSSMEKTSPLGQEHVPSFGGAQPQDKESKYVRKMRKANNKSSNDLLDKEEENQEITTKSEIQQEGRGRQVRGAPADTRYKTMSEGPVQPKGIGAASPASNGVQGILAQNKDRFRSGSRSNQQIRTALLSKLTYEKVWLQPKEKPKMNQTCIIFDWDDTLLCTTFLAPHANLIYDPYMKFPAQLAAKLKELDDAAVQLLAKAKLLGKVYLITNAAEGWIELSANRFMPKTFIELQKDVKVISARAHYEKQFPRNYQKWKVEAFLETRADMEEDALTNLIALGDNIFEIEAAYILGAQYKNSYIKTVKFRQSPSTSELIKQIKLVLTQFELIVNSPKNLTVRLLKQSKDEQKAEAANKAKAQKGTMECDAATQASTNIMKNIKK